MLALSENLIIAKNRLHSQYPWLLLAEIVINDAADTRHRLVQNHENIAVGLNTYGGSGCVAHWKLNDNDWNTTITDASGNGNHGTAQRDTVHLHTNGLGGGAHKQDGATDYTDCNDPFESTFQDSFSISMWVIPDDGQPLSAQYWFGVNKNAGTQDLIHCILGGDGNVLFQYRTDNNLADGRTSAASPLFADGQATKSHHFVFVADASINGSYGLKLYMDGELQTWHPSYTGDTSSVRFSDYAQTINPYLGCRNVAGAAQDYYAGNLDNVMLFNRAISAAEVSLLYNNGLGTELVPALFTGFNFDIDQITYKGGEVPTAALRFSNVTQFLKADLAANNGCTESEIILRLVHADLPTEDYSELDINFSVIYPRITAQHIEFVVGGPSPFRRRVPIDRYFADACRYVAGFKIDPRCGYAGGETTCSGLRSRCRELTNEANFGGFPGLRPEALRLA